MDESSDKEELSNSYTIHTLKESDSGSVSKFDNKTGSNDNLGAERTGFDDDLGSSDGSDYSGKSNSYHETTSNNNIVHVPWPARYRQTHLPIPKSDLPLSITISDDQSVDAKVKERQFTALRTHFPQIRSTDSDPIIINNRLSVPPTPKYFSREGHDQQRQMEYKRRLEQQKQEEEEQRQALERARKYQVQLAMLRSEQGRGNSATEILIPEPSASLLDSRKRPRQADSMGDEESVTGEMDLEELQTYIQRLQSRAKTMGDLSVDKLCFRNHTFYRILRSIKSQKESTPEIRELSSLYFDPPEWIEGQDGAGFLRCSLPVKNLDLYLAQNRDICSIVCHTYVEPTQDELTDLNRGRNIKPHRPTVNISIQPLGRVFRDTVATTLDETDGCANIAQRFRTTGELTAPYTFYYHYRSVFERVLENVDVSTKHQLRLLMDHFTEAEGASHEIAEAMIAEGKVSPRTMDYLIKPGDTVIVRKENEYTGWIATGWARKRSEVRSARSMANEYAKGLRGTVPLQANKLVKKRNGDVILQEWVVPAWQWDFNGTFSRKNQDLTWHILQEINDNDKDKHGDRLSPETTQPVPIIATTMIPLHFCPANIVDKLRKRGQTVWKCRQRRFVSYQEKDNEMALSDNRYMVDLKTYRDLHKDNAWDSDTSSRAAQHELDEEAMERDECPKEQFELLLPLKIKGFHLQRKKWYDLMVDRISDVVWAKEAFSKIVMDSKAKEIVRALISKQLASERSTDLVAGKGNGLILLLHGGPGTGKTLTAESVAEIAEKPLYRVTCGDVGTKAEVVEKYLESVFHLGKRWGCVVLLDEADVFLEQRDLKDLERNALVSVFLRVLEYYEGILILTSNRVGTFDEAFRSRIQLALHYPTLTQFQRLRIWENFIDRLETFKDGAVNITDLKYHLEDLSKREMNGREIRNVITTARQYAEYMGTVLTYAQLEDVINISTRFDTYLGNLHGGLTRDEIAKDEGIR